MDKEIIPIEMLSLSPEVLAFVQFLKNEMDELCNKDQFENTISIETRPWQRLTPSIKSKYNDRVS